jgi:hypothetical protein
MVHTYFLNLINSLDKIEAIINEVKTWRAFDFWIKQEKEDIDRRCEWDSWFWGKCGIWSLYKAINFTRSRKLSKRKKEKLGES